MTLSTHVRIIGSHISGEGLLAKCRELIGIPESQPVTVGLDYCQGSEWVWTRSTPGGFNAALDILSHPGGPANAGLRYHDPEYCDEELGGCTCLVDTPDCDYEVDFDTAYGYRGDGGCDGLHRHLTTELGKWVESLGGDWWAKDEYHGDWWHRTPAPVDKLTRLLNAAS